MADRIISIGEVSKLLGVSNTTVRRMVDKGQIPSFNTPSGHRRFRLSQVRPDLVELSEQGKRTIGYARVCHVNWKEVLDAQEVLIAEYCAEIGVRFEQRSDIGAGFNNYRSGFRYLLAEVLAGRVDRVVMTHRERLGRHGGELVLSVCGALGVQVVILNTGPSDDLSDDLNADLADAGTLFASDFFGVRSGRMTALVDALAKQTGNSGD